MAPKAKGSAKAKVCVGKDNAQSKAQCKAKGNPLDTDNVKGHKGVAQERMKEMVKGVPQMPHNDWYFCQDQQRRPKEMEETMETQTVARAQLQENQ